MANVRSMDNQARLLDPYARGRRVRYIRAKDVILALDRTTIDGVSHILADIIDGETSCTKGIFAAPCDGKIVRVYTNAKTYPVTSGAATIKVSKAVIGASDVDICATIDINGKTAETAIDGVLSTTAGYTNVITGQLVYLTAALSATTSASSVALVVNVEFVPTDAPTP
jgi:hypothetical protein